LKGSVNVEGPGGVKELVEKFGIDCTFTEVDSYTKVFELVESQKADAGVTNKDFGNKHEKDFDVERTPIIFQPRHIQFAFPKNSSITPYFIERIDYHVKKLKEDEGFIYYRSLEKWLAVKPVIPGWVKWALTGIAGLVFLLFGGNFILRSRVRSKTKELKQEIADRKKAEEKVQQSLKEKEILLQEIHHRVKNNMQVISSLLDLQSQYVNDRESLEMFKEGQNRILFMASVHEKLYQSEDLAKINFDGYIRSITHQFLRTYGIDPGVVRLSINCSDVLLDISKAVPCGLIINELIFNSLKHAFPEGERGGITVDFHPDRDNRLTLVVSDTGIELPEDIDISDAETLGLQLISDLVDQVSGTLEIERNGGTAFKITFNQ
jgi:two-component sensor histidine kinase